MKTSKKLISLLLALILCLACLSACDKKSSNDDESDETSKKKKPTTTAAETTALTGNGTGDGDLTTIPDSTTAVTMPPATTSPSAPDTSPKTPDDITYPGQTINVIASNYDWFDDEIYVDAETGNAIPDAIWKRNDLVKTKLGIEFVYHGQDSSSGPGGTNKVLDAIEKQINGGRNDYSVAVANAYSSASKSMEGYFVDLTGISPYFDLNKFYWSQSMNDSLSIGDAQYLCTGPMVLSSYRLMYGTLFNESLFKDHGVEFPYDKVDTKEWTVAYQRSIVETFCNAEVDQDPNATYGFIVNHDGIGCDPYLSALKIPLITKDDNNMFIVSTDSNRTATAMREICDLIYNNKGTTKGTLRIARNGNDNEQNELAKKFAEGTAAMVHLRLMELEGEHIAQMVDSYGILPMPMLNSDQDGYYTAAHDQISVVGVPNTGKSAAELKMIGAFLDLMGYYSYTEVTPVYYNMCLRGRYFDNPRAIDMLDTLTDGLYLDPAVIYQKTLNAPAASWREWISLNKGSSVSSSVTILGRNMQTHVKKINEAFEKIAK